MTRSEPSAQSGKRLARSRPRAGVVEESMGNLVHLQRFLDALPEGIASYPDYQQKASIIKPFIELSGMHQPPEGTPPEIAALIENPPPPSVWIPEVHGKGLWLAAYDAIFAGNEARFREFSMQVNRNIVSQGFYKAIMRLVGPSMSARGVAAAWKSFHRGIEQSYERTGKNSAKITLTYPAHLICDAIAPSYVTAFAAALEVGGTQVRTAALVSYTPTEASFLLER